MWRVSILVTASLLGGAAMAQEPPAAAHRLTELLAGAPVRERLALPVEIQLLVDRTPGATGRRARLVVKLGPESRALGADESTLALEFGVRDAGGRTRTARRNLDARVAATHVIDFVVDPETITAAAVISGEGEARGEATCAPIVADLGPLPGAQSASPAPREPLRPAALRLAPPPEALLAGRREVGIGTTIAGIARLRYLLDGGVVAESDREPWSAEVPFDHLGRAQTLEAVALGADGRELARDAVRVNAPADEAWIRLLPPRREGDRLLVEARLRVPARQALGALEIFAGERLVAVLTREPYEVALSGRDRESGFFRVVAGFDSGAVVEDVLQQLPSGAGSTVEVERVELLPRFFDEKGRPRAVSAADITLLEEGVERPIEDVVSGWDLPLLVGIVIDVSGSMHPYANQFRAEVETLLSQLTPGRDRAFLIVFAANSVLVAPPTTDVTRISTALWGLEAQGETALWDAIAHGLSQFDHKRSVRALVVLTDGENTSGRFSETAVSKIAARVGVPVFPVFPTDESLNYFRRPSLQALIRIAQTTGGESVPFSEPEALPGALRRLFERLRAETLVTFVPSGARPEKATWRRVEIRPKVPGIRVEGELGYFAGGQ